MVSGYPTFTSISRVDGLSTGTPVLGHHRFSIDSKSFEIKTVGVGRKVKVVITERQRGWSSWIRFGEEGARILLKGFESLRKETDKNAEGLRCRENGKRNSLERKKNGHGLFILCTIADLDSKIHRLFFPKEMA